MSQKKKPSKANPGTRLQPTAARVTPQTTAPRAEPTLTRTREKKVREKQDLLFNRESFKWMLIGLGVMILGYILMSGGKMPSPDVWEPERIYSFRRITLAPLVILAGIGIEIYAIFVGARKSSF